MNAEMDHDLTPELWETLKALRGTKPNGIVNGFVENLVALQLVAIIDGVAVMTPQGRNVLLRGSPRLWDVAA